MNPTNEILFGAFLGFFILIASGVIYWMFYDDEVSDVEKYCEHPNCYCNSVCTGIMDRVSTHREVKPSGRKHWSEH